MASVAVIVLVLDVMVVENYAASYFCKLAILQKSYNWVTIRKPDMIAWFLVEKTK